MTYPADFRDDVRQMKKEGLSNRAVARYLGVDEHTVAYIVNPDYRKRQNTRSITNFRKNRTKRLRQMKRYNDRKKRERIALLAPHTSN